MVIDVSNEGIIRHTVGTIKKTAFEEDEIKRFLSEFYDVTIGAGQFGMADRMFLKMIKKGFK